MYCGIDVSVIDLPAPPERATKELQRCHNKGARGVGELADRSWGMQSSEKNARPRDRRLRLGNSRLNAFRKKCAELKIPANIHIADRPSRWEPLGPQQERTSDFQAFNLYGKDVPSYEELLASRDRLLARPPGTRFIFCHFSNQANDTASVPKRSTATRTCFSAFPRGACAFLERYRGRIMFGTDNIVDWHGTGLHVRQTSWLEEALLEPWADRTRMRRNASRLSCNRVGRLWSTPAPGMNQNPSRSPFRMELSQNDQAALLRH